MCAAACLGVPSCGAFSHDAAAGAACELMSPAPPGANNNGTKAIYRRVEAASEPRCPSHEVLLDLGFTLHRGKYYRRSKLGYTYYEGRRHCQEVGADLAMPKNQEDYLGLLEALEASPRDDRSRWGAEWIPQHVQYGIDPTPISNLIILVSRTNP